VTDDVAPLPFTLLGRVTTQRRDGSRDVDPRIAYLAGTAGIIGTTKAKLPAAPSTCGTPRERAHPNDALQVHTRSEHFVPVWLELPTFAGTLSSTTIELNALAAATARRSPSLLRNH
jgi:hypothetical protein